MDKLKFCRLIDTTLDYYTLEPFDMFWTSGESSVFVKDDFKKRGKLSDDHLNLKKNHSVLVKDEVPTSPKVSNNHKVNILHSPVLAIKYFVRRKKKAAKALREEKELTLEKINKLMKKITSAEN